MEKIKDFMSEHIKGFVIGGVLFVATLGFYGIYRLFKD